MSIRELAKQLSDALVTDKRNNGAEFVHLVDKSPQWMTDVIRAVHGDKLPDDTVYAFIEKCANAIADSEDSWDAVMEIEPDCYTADLTSWLNSRADHVYYLTEVLEESEVKDGFQLLALAQHTQIREVGLALISELEKVSE